MIKATKKSKRLPAKNDSAAPAAPSAPSPAPAPAPAAIAPARGGGSVAAEPKRTELSRTARVSLELLNPAAKTVQVAGSFNEWQPEKTPLTRKGDGRWVGDLAIKPGRHEYLFVVDGQWIPDPNAKESVQNPFGGRNSILSVSE